MTDQEKALSEDYIDIMLDGPLPFESVPAEADYCYQTIDENLIILHQQSTALPFFDINHFAYQVIPNLYGLMENGYSTLGLFDPTPLSKSGIQEMQRYPMSLTGKGVVIGFVDTGIQFDNTVFRNQDGSSRILAIWDQTIQEGTPPQGFLLGSEYRMEDINQALLSEHPRQLLPTYDEHGHGTAIASVAAGSLLGDGLLFQGAAPDADIVMVKCKPAKKNIRDYYLIADNAEVYSEVDIILGVKYLQQLAISLRRPVVICLSMGSNMGDHTGSSTLAGYINRLATQRNLAIIASGGNEGNQRHHYYEEFDEQITAIGYSSVEIRVGEGEKGFVVHFWGSLPNTFSLAIQTPSGETTEFVDFKARATRRFSFIYIETIVEMNYVMIEQNSGEELCFIKFHSPIPGVWTIRVKCLDGINRRCFHMWLPLTEFLTTDTYFLQSSPYCTLTEPSMARDIITVTAYNDYNDSFYPESGRGYTRKDEYKPDLAAPGVDIFTILGRRSGSSIAAAITAGAAAQFLQWCVTNGNNIYVETRELKSYFIRGADRTQAISYPSMEWGYGRLNLAGVFRKLAGLE